MELSEILLIILFIVLGLIFLGLVFFIIWCSITINISNDKIIKIQALEAEYQELIDYLTEISTIAKEADLDDDLFNQCKDAREYNLKINDPKRYLTQEQFELLATYDPEVVENKMKELENKKNAI